MNVIRHLLPVTPVECPSNCKYRSTEINLQYIPVTPTLQCAQRKTLGPRTKQLIQNAIEKMNYSNTYKVSPLPNNIEMITERLRDLRQDIIKMSEANLVML